MSKNKRMIYIYDENLKLYDEMSNKSEWINEKLRELKEEKGEEVQPKLNFEDKIRKHTQWNSQS